MRLATLAAASSLLFAAASADDVKAKFPIKKAVSTAVFDEKVGHQVKFFFGDPRNAPGGKSFGYASCNAKGSTLKREGEDACDWVFASCMIEMRAQADSAGADAIVGIESIYGGKVFSSDSLFECHLGKVASGVALRGNLIKIMK